MSAKVFVTIDPKDGTRTYEVEGVGGVACEEITRVLAESNEVKEYQHTAEYFEQEQLPEYLSAD